MSVDNDSVYRGQVRGGHVGGGVRGGGGDGRGGVGDLATTGRGAEEVARYMKSMVIKINTL